MCSRNRRPTLYGDAALAGFERAPSVTEATHAGHMESEVTILQSVSNR